MRCLYGKGVSVFYNGLIFFQEDFEDVKPDITKLSFPEEQKLAYTKGISEEHVKNIKSEKTRSSLVADYGGGSSSDSSN